jgi:hypothetical protein
VANAGRLEALLARHWPELLALGTAIGLLLLKLLVELPSPQRITADLEQARRLLRRHRSADKMTALVMSATTSQGVVMIEEEEVAIRELAGQMLTQRREIEHIDRELRELLQPATGGAEPTLAEVLQLDETSVSETTGNA